MYMDCSHVVFILVIDLHVHIQKLNLLNDIICINTSWFPEMNPMLSVLPRIFRVVVGFYMNFVLFIQVVNLSKR